MSVISLTPSLSSFWACGHPSRECISYAVGLWLPYDLVLIDVLWMEEHRLLRSYLKEIAWTSFSFYRLQCNWTKNPASSLCLRTVSEVKEVSQDARNPKSLMGSRLSCQSVKILPSSSHYTFGSLCYWSLVSVLTHPLWAPILVW